ncbi:hypothetical protein C1H46_020086 [Malus baccata]|uniref:Uncharacterized protein n=1 Tax=Malus baccata TaxID=106549 RepID=A0A540M6X6_MALBA|nr:hypothetical protein C1H46_020086 [Malus baccata]
MGYGVGAGVVVILLIVWEEGRNWLEDSIDKILLAILPMMGYSYKTRAEWDDEEEEDSEEESTYIMPDYSRDEIVSEDRVFRGPYCVFCSKLDMSRKRAIHDPNCTCHFSPPITSSSSSSHSFSP